MAEDLIIRFCDGNPADFIERCPHFIFASEECDLLTDSPMQRVFEQGRCLPEKNLLKPTVRGTLTRYADLFHDDLSQPENYLDSLTFEIAERIKRCSLKKGFTIYVLKEYINRAVENGVLDFLIAEGKLSRRICGNCCNLSLSEPYSCHRKTIVNFHGEEVENAWYMQPRNQSDAACKTGFEPYRSENESAKIFDRKDSAALPLPGWIEQIEVILSERAARESLPKKKAIYERHYAIFVNMKHFLSEGMERRAAIEKIADDLGETLKTVYGDLNEIQKYLQQKNVVTINYRNDR